MKKKKKMTSRKKGGASARKKKRIGTIRASAADPRDSEEFVAMYRPIKKPVTLRLDADVVAWFKVNGKGYQTRINQALRQVMKHEKRRG